MKHIFVDERWCLACHLCEYWCAYANSGENDMVRALQGRKIAPRIRIENAGGVSFAVACRHCDEPWCVKSCITGALTKRDGVVTIDGDRCVGCLTCVLSCPYGAVLPGPDGAVNKCELCTTDSQQTPACVSGCPNRAIVLEEI